MTQSRSKFIRGFIFLLLFGSLLSLVWDREIWPFSPYPMYSGLQTQWRFERLALVGVEGDREFPVWSGCNLPNSYYRLRYWLEGHTSSDPQQVRTLLKRCLQQTSWDAIRVIRQSWNLAEGKSPGTSVTVLEVNSP